MRNLSDEEVAIRGRRRAGLEVFVQESMPVLIDFMERLELPYPDMVLKEAEKYAAPLDAWMRDQVIEPGNRIWILTRIGYFIGELLNQRLGGCWFLDEDAGSPYFLQYVVGQFTRLNNPNARIAPFALADYYVAQPPGRDLLSVIRETEERLRQQA